MEEARIDKYLWCIRVFKTRSEAAEACKGGKVKIGGDNAKPAKEVHPGDIIKVRKGAVQYTYRVIKLAGARMGAALVPEYAENLTPEDEIQKAKSPAETIFFHRDKGSGRPTKKDRRAMEALWDGFSTDDE